MNGYSRTAIRRLSIHGYRSIRDLELGDIPDLVVLHGPNGAGKSNLLLAVQLVLRAATLGDEVPLGHDQAVTLTPQAADAELDLRPDDFHFGIPPEIRIAVEIELGEKTAMLMDEPMRKSLGLLSAELVVQRAGKDLLRYWFERADVDGRLSLRLSFKESDGEPETPELTRLRRLAQQLSTDLDEAEFDAERRATAISAEQDGRPTISQLRSKIRRLQTKLREIKAQERALLVGRQPETYFLERLRSVVLPQLLQVSPAYRVPGLDDDPQEELFRAFLSEDRRERAATLRLGQRLAKAQLFGADRGQIALTPVDSDTYHEELIYFNHPTHGELPLRNLGSGEQQIIYMLGQRVITPFPITFLEEPEAHLHTSLMEPFARVLLDSVAGLDGPPDVDQLWIATHHHQFALALEYFDVKVMDGATVVKRLPRAKAAGHFFEPGPIWEALRQLARSAKERESVMFRDATGAPITAAQILDSIEKDPDQRVAREYARAMTEAMVMAMRQRAEKAP